ncbi:histone H2A deubiquitinase MYSM1 isoform X2 [Xenopus laevis]|uniref:Myb-like, SWIRM and MPN domain-containing protein 1 n=1 Tax=Xenopus laevis TaxID=8355 RepID=A0A8J0V3M5_XENLA|nr:histone H2A deubiquitinase MYSM1 isoform X2 [Xenopus laevis]
MAEEAADVDIDIEGDINESSKSIYDSLNTGFAPEHYIESAWQNEEGLAPWALDSSISEENREAIKKMLLEEEYYLSNKPLAVKFWSDSQEGEKQCIKRVRSPAKASSSPVKWTKEEKNLFEQGLATFGRRWTSIARLIGSRSVLQVKNYARHYFKNKCKLEGFVKEEAKIGSLQIPNLQDYENEPDITDEPTTFRGRADPNLNAIKIEKLSDDEEIDITDEVDELLSNKTNLDTIIIAKTDKVKETKVETEVQQKSHSTTEHSQTDIPKLVLQQTETECLDSVNPLTCITSPKWTLSPQQCEEDDYDQPDVQDCLQEKCLSPHAEDLTVLCENENDSQDEDDEIKPPDQELEIDRNFILDEEKQAIPEFFEGRQAKTPDRYLRIRNYILDQWENCKPKYLNKTSVRPGLKNCGDVNCIGRIHTYLELIGAINFGCEQAIYNRPRPVDKTKCKEGKDTLEAYKLAHRLQSMRTRKRRVRDPWGNWCDAKDLEGQTYEHLSAEELARRHEDKIKSYKYSKGTRQVRSSFDPFQLIPCSAFSEEKKAPFQVKVSCEAMLVLDLHAHVSMAEVIGLLGGRYTESESVVEICAVEPCNSLSTGLQCEMDPVSQTQASEALASRGYSVIGWYHSHPAFDPNPSIRDIDTQAKYQNYFSRGGAKFLGMIISPYNRRNPHPQSQVACLIISDELSNDGSYRIPYKFEIEYMQGEPQWELVFAKTRWIIEKYRSSHRGSNPQGTTQLATLYCSVSMDKRFRHDSELTCLQKLLMCMKKTLGNTACPLITEEFLHRIEEYFRTSYKKESNYQIEDNDPCKQHSDTTFTMDSFQDYEPNGRPSL